MKNSVIKIQERPSSIGIRVADFKKEVELLYKKSRHDKTLQALGAISREMLVEAGMGW